MKKNQLINTLPVIIGILVSWGIYVILIEAFNIHQIVEGNSVSLVFIMLLTYLLTLILIFNFRIFRKALYIYTIIVLIVILTNEQLYIISNLFMMFLGCLLGFLGFVLERIASYFLKKILKE